MKELRVRLLTPSTFWSWWSTLGSTEISFRAGRKKGTMKHNVVVYLASKTLRILYSVKWQNNYWLLQGNAENGKCKLW